jgi:hypothetical protein
VQTVPSALQAGKNGVGQKQSGASSARRRGDTKEVQRQRVNDKVRAGKPGKPIDFPGFDMTKSPFLKIKSLTSFTVNFEKLEFSDNLTG